MNIRHEELLSKAKATKANEIFIKKLSFKSQSNKEHLLKVVGNFLLEAMMDPDIDEETFKAITELKLGNVEKFERLYPITVGYELDATNAFELISPKEFAKKYLKHCHPNNPELQLENFLPISNTLYIIT